MCRGWVAWLLGLLTVLKSSSEVAPRMYDIGINTVEFSCLRLEATHRRYSHVENRRHASSGAGLVIRAWGFITLTIRRGRGVLRPDIDPNQHANLFACSSPFRPTFVGTVCVQALPTLAR